MSESVQVWTKERFPKDVVELLNKVLERWEIHWYENGQFYLVQFDDKGKPAYTVSTFRISEFPGCCGMGISNRAEVHKDFRLKGIGRALNKLRIHLAKELRYSRLVATTVSTNLGSNKILLENGWTKTGEFVNVKTKNTINVYSVNL